MSLAWFKSEEKFAKKPIPSLAIIPILGNGSENDLYGLEMSGLKELKSLDQYHLGVSRIRSQVAGISNANDK